MDEQTKTKNCIERNIKNIVETFTIGDNIIEVQQRKLTVGEVDSYSRLSDDIFEDKDVFNAIMKQQEVQQSNKLLTDKDKEVLKLDNDTLFIIRKATQKVNKASFNLDTNFIIFSVSPSKLHGGYFKLNGEIVPKEDLYELISDLTDEDYRKLLKNAKSLQYPTVNDIEDAKS